MNETVTTTVCQAGHKRLCRNAVSAKGLCQRHYSMLKVGRDEAYINADADDPPTKNVMGRPKKLTICHVNHCPNGATADNLCKRHYDMRRNGAEDWALQADSMKTSPALARLLKRQEERSKRQEEKSKSVLNAKPRNTWQTKLTRDEIENRVLHHLQEQDSWTRGELLKAVFQFDIAEAVRAETKLSKFYQSQIIEYERAQDDLYRNEKLTLFRTTVDGKTKVYIYSI